VLVGCDRALVGQRAISAHGAEILVLDTAWHGCARPRPDRRDGPGLRNRRPLPRGPLRAALCGRAPPRSRVGRAASNGRGGGRALRGSAAFRSAGGRWVCPLEEGAGLRRASGCAGRPARGDRASLPAGPRVPGRGGGGGAHLRHHRDHPRSRRLHRPPSGSPPKDGQPPPSGRGGAGRRARDRARGGQEPARLGQARAS
jgi:hypothetical protein